MKKFSNFLELYAYRYKALLTGEPLDPEVQVNGVIYKLNGNNYEKTPKVYKALLTQSATNVPTATVLENTLGEIVWSRSSDGTYIGTLTGAFPENRTFAQITNNTSATNFYVINRINDNTIQIQTFGSSILADGLLNSTPIIIEIY